MTTARQCRGRVASARSSRANSRNSLPSMASPRAVGYDDVLEDLRRELRNHPAVEISVGAIRRIERAPAMHLDGDTDGFVKVHVRAGSDRIVGATVVARHAGEMISELTLAMVGGLGLRTLARTIHPYPTQAEAIKRVADAYNRTRLTPFVKGLFEKWLAWMR